MGCRSMTGIDYLTHSMALAISARNALLADARQLSTTTTVRVLCAGYFVTGVTQHSGTIMIAAVGSRGRLHISPTRRRRCLGIHACTETPRPNQHRKRRYESEARR